MQILKVFIKNTAHSLESSIYGQYNYNDRHSLIDLSATQRY